VAEFRVILAYKEALSYCSLYYFCPECASRMAGWCVDRFKHEWGGIELLEFMPVARLEETYGVCDGRTVRTYHVDAATDCDLDVFGVFSRLAEQSNGN